MKLHFLGTSHGLASLKRANSSCLVMSKGGSLLVDCGEPASATLLRMAVLPEQPCALVLTHLHPDHTGGFTQLIQTLQLKRRTSPFTVYMPEEGIAVFKTLLRTVYLYDSVLPFQLRFRAIRPEIVFEDTSFSFRFYPNEHLACYRAISMDEGYPAPCESFSVHVTADQQSIVFSGDIKNPGELIAPLRKGADLLVSELVHFPPVGYAEIPQGLLPGKICFTHYKTTREDASLEKDDPALVSLNKKIIFAEDGMEIEVLKQAPNR